MHNSEPNRFGIAAAVAVAMVAVCSLQAQAKQHEKDDDELASGQVPAQCSASDPFLEIPTGITQSSRGNLLVAESGTAVPNTGRISIVDLSGNRRTLVAGLPSGISDVGTPNGPSGLFMRGRTLYIAIGTGDVGRNGPLPGTSIPNPSQPPSSPIFSSVLALHFSSHAEETTDGFTLTRMDQLALAGGQTLHLSDSGGRRLTIELVVKLPNYTPKPLASYPANIDLTNPFALVAVGKQLYVTDGGQNVVWQIDIATGSYSKLVEFPDIRNPLFPALGGPIEEAVPTGIAYSAGRLLVTLFSGVPFAPGTSTVEQVDLAGAHAPFLTGLKTAIGVLPVEDGDDEDDAAYLVLQNASVGPFFNGPGLVLRFASSDGPPTVLANCLTRPTAMTLDRRSSTLYVTDLAGHVVAVSLKENHGRR